MINSEPPPRLYTVETLAEHLSVKPATIRRWRASTPRQGPPAVKVGDLVRWRPEDVEAWLLANREAWETEDGPVKEAGGEMGPGSTGQTD